MRPWGLLLLLRRRRRLHLAAVSLLLLDADVSSSGRVIPMLQRLLQFGFHRAAARLLLACCLGHVPAS
jgi:hypothetical protein